MHDVRHQKQCEPYPSTSTLFFKSSVATLIGKTIVFYWMLRVKGVIGAIRAIAIKDHHHEAVHEKVSIELTSHGRI